jgi:gluconolactonase
MTRLSAFYLACMSLGWLAMISNGVCGLQVPVREASEDRIPETNAKVEKLADGMTFTEGPVWMPAKNTLVFSDIPNARLMEWSEAQGLKEFRRSDKSNGNILDLEGRLISCQHGARNVVRTEPDGTITVLVDRFGGKRFNSPNDAAIRSDGTIWFTDPCWGLEDKPELEGHWVFKLNPESGAIQTVIEDMSMPNGIVFSPDEKRLYVSDTGGHPRHPDRSFHQHPACVRCYEISSEGELGKLRFTIDRGSDGMAVDVEGNLYITDADKVFVYSADGEKVTEITVPENPANVCFGGEDDRTLFITARTSLYSIRLKNAGAKPLGAKW